MKSKMIKKALRKILPKGTPIMEISDEEFENNLILQTKEKEQIINANFKVINEVAMQQAEQILKGLKKEDIKVYVNGEEKEVS